MSAEVELKVNLKAMFSERARSTKVTLALVAFGLVFMTGDNYIASKACESFNATHPINQPDSPKYSPLGLTPRALDC